ncbi:MAG: hypothetical protein AAF957_25060 [Planctomycetota bacterium]
MSPPAPNPPGPSPADPGPPDGGRTAGFEPGAGPRGEVRVPASKSIAQRALAAAAVARGTSEILGLPSSDDVVAGLRSARALGATFPSDGKPDDLLATALMRRSGLGRLSGVPPGHNEGPRPWCKLPVGESGTSARLFTALAALARPAGSGAEVVPAGSLARRSSPALFRALRGAGVGIEHGGTDDGWPVLLTAAAPPEVLDLDAPTSSQEVSALLLALAVHSGERRLRVIGGIPSRGYVDVTRSVLAAFGASVRSEPVASDRAEGSGELFTVRGPLTPPPDPLHCESDASSAAVALAAGVLTGGHEVVVRGVGTASRQPDAAVVGALAAFGCDTSDSDVERLVARGTPTRGARIDCTATPDLAPVLAAVGAYAAREVGEESELVGLETLPGKESSRIEVLAEGIQKIGLAVEHDDRSLRIAPRSGSGSGPASDSGRSGRDVLLDPHGDHRMAFCFALLSLFEPGVRTLDPGCVGKSWPSFWTDLVRAGATLGAP